MFLMDYFIVENTAARVSSNKDLMSLVKRGKIQYLVQERDQLQNCIYGRERHLKKDHNLVSIQSHLLVSIQVKFLTLCSSKENLLKLGAMVSSNKQDLVEN